MKIFPFLLTSYVIRVNVFVLLRCCLLLLHVWLFAIPWTATHQASLSFTITWSLLKLMSIESVIPSNHLMLCCSPLLLQSFCLQSFPAPGFFPVSWLFASGGRSIGASASASVLPMNIQGWFPLGLTGLISWLSRRLSEVFSRTIIQKCQFFSTQLIQLSHPYMTTGKIIALTIQFFVCKVMPLLCNTLSRFVIAFLWMSKHLLIL